MDAAVGYAEIALDRGTLEKKENLEHGESE